MPRARPRSAIMYRQTAAAPQDQGSGCLSDFLLVPIAVIIVSALLASFAWNQNMPADDLPPAMPANISPIFRIEILYWSDSISSWAAASHLDPNLVATIMQIESCGDPRAKSSAGAMGLFQVMPFHFYAIDDPYSPNTNAARGLTFLARSLETAGGNVRLAMAGYNGGIDLIGRAEWTWPAETQRYVRYGAPIYEDARNRVISSTALNEWYEKYGVALCQQAHQQLGLP
jgi:soluble lytic murein transglycosylase-like protein